MAISYGNAGEQSTRSTVEGGFIVSSPLLVTRSPCEAVHQRTLAARGATYQEPACSGGCNHKKG